MNTSVCMCVSSCKDAKGSYGTRRTVLWPRRHVRCCSAYLNAGLLLPKNDPEVVECLVLPSAELPQRKLEKVSIRLDNLGALINFEKLAII